MSSIEKAIERLAKSKAKQSKPDSVADGSTKAAHQDQAEETAKSVSVSAKPAADNKDFPAGGGEGGSTVATVADSAKRPAKKIQLDYESLSKVGYIVPEAGNKQLAEEYRIIKRPIIMNALGKGAAPIEHGNLVSISSSLPAEGKTFTALNLALSMATELDSTVLLIDGDVLKSSMSKLLGIEQERGLIDLLEDKRCSVNDVILHTQIPRLKVISSGNRSEKSTELLASKEMERLLNELADRYRDRIIIFDSPPILATSEAEVLNLHMGQILLVVEAGQTPVDAIKDALSRLDGEKAIGLVLNKSREGTTKNYYGTYY
ncbi:MAG: XrtA-associated tyrosine autokinase [Candidatus Thiodiazotropha sp. (ex Epidulcina cf. delphinae)]|nr:XrtA-associated tyrosine autokinase [Candidatus Thiodiazotropha sp. (ex Epidulcina cf. delphinae)]